MIAAIIDFGRGSKGIFLIDSDAYRHDTRPMQDSTQSLFLISNLSELI
jgi:hypothetical protein